MLEQQKNKIELNRPKMSVEKVREKENFESIVNQHRKITKRPIYKQKKFYFILFLILIITYFLYVSEKEGNNQSTKNNTEEQR